MYYSELVKKASNIMFESAKDQKDKGGYPYVFHPFFLASQMYDEDSACAALLHDTIEDHSDVWNFEKLSEAGFNDRIIGALRLLTHDDSVPYMDYVRELAKNPVARKVKIADLRHNLDTRRVNGQKPPKYDTYMEALVYLESI